MDQLIINNNLALPLNEIDLSAIRAQGAGGQNVNKVSSAIHLRFDIHKSALPPVYKERLLNLKDHRISKDGMIIIKAQQYRTQEKNKEDALQRLAELILSVTYVEKVRRPTRPTRNSQTRRLEGKTRRAEVKANRSKRSFD